MEDPDRIFTWEEEEDEHVMEVHDQYNENYKRFETVLLPEVKTARTCMVMVYSNVKKTRLMPNNKRPRTLYHSPFLCCRGLRRGQPRDREHAGGEHDLWREAGPVLLKENIVDLVQKTHHASPSNFERLERQRSEEWVVEGETGIQPILERFLLKLIIPVSSNVPTDTNYRGLERGLTCRPRLLLQGQEDATGENFPRLDWNGPESIQRQRFTSSP